MLSLLFTALDGEFQFEKDHIDLDAEAQVDLAKLPADRPETAGRAAAKLVRSFADIFHVLLLCE